MQIPDTDALRRAGWVSMVRHPDTPAATAFTADTLDTITPHMARTRPLEAKGRPGMLQDLGTVLVPGIIEA